MFVDLMQSGIVVNTRAICAVVPIEGENDRNMRFNLYISGQLQPYVIGMQDYYKICERTGAC